jgi:hypothetical protein
MITYKLETNRQSVSSSGEKNWEGRIISTSSLRHILKYAQCNGIVSLKYTISQGSRRPQLRDSGGRFVSKKTSDTPDTVYLSEKIGEPDAEVWYHLDLTTDMGCSTVSVVTDGKVVSPTYQHGWGHSECQWQKEWRLLRSVKELRPDFQWRAEILGRFTDLDKQLIEASINKYWDLQKENDGLRRSD